MERIKKIRILYSAFIGSFILSQFFPYVINRNGDPLYPSFLTVVYIILHLVGALFMIISDIVIKKSARAAITIAMIGIIFLGIFLVVTDMMVVFVIFNEATFGVGFYIGFISWCAFIWIIILLSKYDKERFKRLIAIGKSQVEDYEEILKNKPSLKDSKGQTEIVEKEGGLIGFFSYSMKDSQLFNIREIAEKLSKFDEIDEILYCEEDSRDNFIKYMDENIGKCDVVILFCSPHALKSGFVEDEWMAAHAMKKPIIPVFLNKEHIPPLLRARIGVEFDVFNSKKNVKNIYNVIIKKLEL